MVTRTVIPAFIEPFLSLTHIPLQHSLLLNRKSLGLLVKFSARLLIQYHVLCRNLQTFELCRRHNLLAVEDEIHVMFNCEAYNDIRNLYIDRDDLTCAEDYSGIKLMNAYNTDCMVKLAYFVSCMFKIRQQLYDSFRP